MAPEIEVKLQVKNDHGKINILPSFLLWWIGMFALGQFRIVIQPPSLKRSSWLIQFVDN